MKNTAICPSRYFVYRTGACPAHPGVVPRRLLDHLLTLALAAVMTVAVIAIFLFLAVL